MPTIKDALDALQNMASGVTLNGIVEADETFSFPSPIRAATTAKASRLRCRDLSIKEAIPLM
jgi:hypothetical protein